MKLRNWLVVALLGAAGYLAIFGGEYSVFDLIRLEREREAEARELERLERELERMRARIDSLETDSAALERLARERYGLIRDGERLYHFVEEPAGDSAAGDAAADAPAEGRTTPERER